MSPIRSFARLSKAFYAEDAVVYDEKGRATDKKARVMDQALRCPLAIAGRIRLCGRLASSL
jgi:hypothetical protein